MTDAEFNAKLERYKDLSPHDKETLEMSECWLNRTIETCDKCDEIIARDAQQKQTNPTWEKEGPVIKTGQTTMFGVEEPTIKLKNRPLPSTKTGKLLALCLDGKWRTLPELQEILLRQCIAMLTTSISARLRDFRAMGFRVDGRQREGTRNLWEYHVTDRSTP